MPTNLSASTIQVGPGQVPAGSLDSSAVSSDLAYMAAEGFSTVLGLDDAYRRNPVSGVSAPVGTGGNTVQIDKGAFTLRAPSILPSTSTDRWNSCLATDEYSDGAALWPVVVAGNSAGWSTLGGSLGLVREVPFRGANSASQDNLSTKRGPSILEVNLLQFNNDYLTDRGNTAVPTYIRGGQLGTLNPAGAGGDIIQCNAGDYFKLAAPNQGIETCIRLGLDLIQVKLASGQVNTYIITQIVTDQTVRVVDLNYNTPSFTANTLANLRIYQPSVMIGGSDITLNSHSMGSTAGEWARPFVFSWAPYASYASGFDTPTKPGLFLSRGRTVAGSQSTTPAYEVGECNNLGSGTANITVTFTQYGDGSNTATGGRQAVNLLSRRANQVARGDGVSFVGPIDLNLGSLWHVAWTGSGTTTIYFGFGSVTPISNTAIQAGDEFELVISRNQSTPTGDLTATWPPDFKFSGSDGTIPQNSNFKVLYRFVFDGTDWLATRNTY